VPGHLPSGRRVARHISFILRVVRAFALWTQRVLSKRRVSRQMASRRLFFCLIILLFRLCRLWRPDDECQGKCRPADECHGKWRTDDERQGILLPDDECQRMWRLDDAYPQQMSTGRGVSGHMPSRRRVSWHISSGRRVSGHLPAGRCAPRYIFRQVPPHIPSRISWSEHLPLPTRGGRAYAY